MVSCFFQKIFSLSSFPLYLWALSCRFLTICFPIFYVKIMHFTLIVFWEILILPLKSYDIKKNLVKFLQQTAIIYQCCVIQSIKWKLTCFTYHIHILFSSWTRQCLNLLMIRKTNLIQKQIFLRILEVACAGFIKPLYIFASGKFICNTFFSRLTDYFAWLLVWN